VVLEAARPTTVSIELSPGQVQRVLRAAAPEDAVSLALAGLSDVRGVLARAPGLLDDGRLSRSLILGLLLLAASPSDGGYIANSELAEILELSASTTHRYVSTLVAVGLMERDPTTRKYRIAQVD
jgi:hypothetical protein